MDMSKQKQAVSCYIGSYEIPKLDNFLEENNFYRGMILFSVPEYGILFRCRVSGSHIEMEFAAFFGLLNFIKDNLKDEKITVVKVRSSYPDFVFAFSGGTNYLNPESAKFKLYKELSKQFKIHVEYIEPLLNQSLSSAVEYPRVPEPDKIKLHKETRTLQKPAFKPFQLGVSL